MHCLILWKCKSPFLHTSIQHCYYLHPFLVHAMIINTSTAFLLVRVSHCKLDTNNHRPSRFSLLLGRVRLCSAASPALVGIDRSEVRYRRPTVTPRVSRRTPGTPTPDLRAHSPRPGGGCEECRAGRPSTQGSQRLSDASLPRRSVTLREESWPAFNGAERHRDETQV